MKQERILRRLSPEDGYETKARINACGNSEYDRILGGKSEYRLYDFGNE